MGTWVLGVLGFGPSQSEGWELDLGRNFCSHRNIGITAEDAKDTKEGNPLASFVSFVVKFPCAPTWSIQRHGKPLAIARNHELARRPGVLKSALEKTPKSADLPIGELCACD